MICDEPICCDPATVLDGPDDEKAWCDRHNPDAPQTALVLTQQEWDDLASICDFYERSFRGIGDRARPLALAERIIEANQ